MRIFVLPAVCLLAVTLASAQTKAGAKPKSRNEAQMVNGLLQAPDPDSRIKAAEDLVAKYRDSDFKSLAFYMEADAYQQKGDNVKAIVFGEQAIDADPQAMDARVLLANILANMTRDTDLDKDEKLTRAEKYANDALAIINTAAKPDPKMTEDKWDNYKKYLQSQAWQALGTVALLRKKIDEAVADYQKGVDATPDPLLMIRAGRALLVAKKPEDAVVWFDKAINAPDATDQVKNIATQDKARATAQIKK